MMMKYRLISGKCQKKIAVGARQKYHKTQKFNDWFRTFVKEYIKQCRGFIYKKIKNY